MKGNKLGRPLTGTEKKQVRSIRVAPSIEKQIIKKHGSLQGFIDSFPDARYEWIFYYYDSEEEELVKHKESSKEELKDWIRACYPILFGNPQNMGDLFFEGQLTDTEDNQYCIQKTKRGKK